MSTETEAANATAVAKAVPTKTRKPRKARITREQRLEQAFAANPAARTAVNGVALAEKLDKVLSTEPDAAVRAYAIMLVNSAPTEPACANVGSSPVAAGVETPDEP